MEYTLTELKERLSQCDEIELFELLGLTSQDLIDRFGDIIENKYDELLSELELLEDENEHEKGE